MRTAGRVPAVGAVVVAFLMSFTIAPLAAMARTADACEFWVAPDGDDDDAGTAESPWASLHHAADRVPDRGCIVWFEPGVYEGRSRISRRFASPTTFRAVDPYRAVIQHNRTVVQISGAANVIFEGFEIRHADPGSEGYVVIVDRKGDTWAEHVAFRNNIFRDSYDNDLLKIHNGVRFATVAGNLFFNQGDGEQHLDINSVTDVIVEDNILFNDFKASGRSDGGSSKHYIVVKDSNEGADGLLGSERVTIRRNVFLNWQGGAESFITIGNDGKPYREAKGVRVVNNLFLGNSDRYLDAAFHVRGAQDVQFINNTTVGDLPSKWYAYRVFLGDDNPPNKDIVFANNIWSDPTGTMSDEGRGRRRGVARNNPNETVGLLHVSNLFWNGGKEIPPGRILSPLVEDEGRLVADPGLESDHSDVRLPYWDGERFPSGSASIRQEFLRLVESYGAIPETSPAVDAGDPALAPVDDIRGRRRGVPDIGAYEAGGQPLASLAQGEPAGDDMRLLVLSLLVPSLGLAGWAARRLHRVRRPTRPALRLVDPDVVPWTASEELVDPDVVPWIASDELVDDKGERR
jgi:hypothetical protein